MAKRNSIEMKKSDFVALHNKLNEVIWKMGMHATKKEGMTYDEVMEVFKLIYPFAKGTQDMAIENDFTACVAGIVKQ